jgi:hypothetical protein
MTAQNLKKVAEKFKKMFPEFETASDEECFALVCYIQCNRKKG